MSEESVTVRLIKLHCYQNDEEGYDDIFLVYNGKKIWPVDKKHEDVSIGTVPLNVDIPNIKPMQEMVIDVWDHDKLSPNDLYGRAKFFPDKRGSGTYTVDMKPINDREIARYSIDWEVL